MRLTRGPEFDDGVPRLTLWVYAEPDRAEVVTTLTDAAQTIDTPPATAAEIVAVLRERLAAMARIGPEFGGNVYNATEANEEWARTATALIWPASAGDGGRLRLRVRVDLTRAEVETALTDAVQGTDTPPASIAAIEALLREHLASTARTGAEFGGNVYNATDAHREWAGGATARLWTVATPARKTEAGRP